jgi:hypothetical protein
VGGKPHQAGLAANGQDPVYYLIVAGTMLVLPALKRGVRGAIA